jgi:cytochrome c
MPPPASRYSSDCAPPCHDIGPDAKIKLGPPLNAIDGRKTGTFEGFSYSPVNKSSSITWSEETFPKYIRAPMQEIDVLASKQ